MNTRNDIWRDLAFWGITLAIVVGAIAVVYSQIRYGSTFQRDRAHRRACAAICDVERTDLYPLDRPRCIDNCVWERKEREE